MGETQKIELPPSGKPYYLLSDQELKSFDYYRQNGGRLGIHVSLKYMQTDHVGIQLVVIVKAINTPVVAKKEVIIDGLTELYSSVSSEKYKDQLIQSNSEKVADLYAVDFKKKENHIHHYRLNHLLEVEDGVFIPKPKTLMSKVKFLFGLY
jgi:hypothetical protein